MSASDAAPLPRLGEVFFDVRGSSRSMRLSWYADTGVAVFSIWQGGMCTGTFRLPIGDLPRMVEILQRGPHGQEPLPGGQGAGRGVPSGAYPEPQDFPTSSVVPAGSDGGYAGDPRLGYGRDGYGRDGYGEPAAVGYGPGEPTTAGYAPAEPADASRVPYGRDELAEARQAAYRREEYRGAGSGGYGRDAFSDEPYPGYRPEHQPDARHAGPGRDDGAETMAAGYGQERFVPPYVHNPSGDYGNDIPARAAEIPTGPRRGAYREERPAGRSAAGEFDEPQWAPADYSDGPRYRLPADDPRGYERRQREYEDPDSWT
jgi:hypothetical protein